MSTQDFLMRKIQEEEGNYFKIINSLIKNGIEKDKALKIYQDYNKYKILLNNDNIYFFDYFNKEDKNIKSNFENLSDDIHKSIVKSNHNKIRKKIYSKHNNLINDKTENLIKLFAEDNISPKIISQFVGKKIRAFNNSDELNKELEKLYDEINGSWNISNYLEKFKNTDSHILLNENNKLVVEIKDFEDSKKLGTKNWCVSREKVFYNDYTENKERFVFIFDFNQAPFIEESMKAVILEVDGKVQEVYNKSDIKIENNSVLEYADTFKPIDKELLIYKIKNGRNNIIDSPKVYASEFIIYGLYDEAKDILKEDYKNYLSYVFSNKLSQITNSNNTIEFLHELNKEVDIELLNSYDIFEWIRETSYLKHDVMKDFFNIDIVNDLIKQEVNDNKEELNEIQSNELSEAITSFFNNEDNKKFEQGHFLINKMNGLGFNNSKKLINLKNVSCEALDFLNENNLINKENDLNKDIIKAKKDEEFFIKYFEIIDLKSKDNKFFEELSTEIFSNLLNNYGSKNFNGLYFGLKNYFGKDFKNIKEKHFKMDNPKINIFNIMVSPKNIKEDFSNFTNIFNLDKISPEISRNLVIKSLYGMTESELNDLPFEKQNNVLKDKFSDLPPPLIKYHINFIENENFDLSQSKDIMNKISKIEGFEKFKNKNNKNNLNFN
jgi:hypothetical protein